MGRAHTAGGVLVGSAATTAAAQFGLGLPSDFSALVKDCKLAAGAALKSFFSTTDSAQVIAVARPDMELQTALKASVAGIEALLRSQQSSSRWRVAALVCAPIAVALAVRFLGWEFFGWVTPRMLTEGLENVGRAVTTMGEGLHQRLELIDSQLTAAVTEAKDELQAEVRQIGAQVAAIDERIRPVEADAQRSAQGVDLLCELVATSKLFDKASPESLRRLDAFTGTASAREDPHPTPPRAELMAPTPPSLAQAAPSFMRALMEPPAGVPAR